MRRYNFYTLGQDDGGYEINLDNTPLDLSSQEGTVPLTPIVDPSAGSPLASYGNVTGSDSQSGIGGSFFNDIQQLVSSIGGSGTSSTTPSASGQGATPATAPASSSGAAAATAAGSAGSTAMSLLQNPWVWVGGAGAVVVLLLLTSK